MGTVRVVRKYRNDLAILITEVAKQEKHCALLSCIILNVLLETRVPKTRTKSKNTFVKLCSTMLNKEKLLTLELSHCKGKLKTKN